MSTKKINLKEIADIPVNDFEDIMKNWLNEQNTVKNLHAKMRMTLFTNFYNTKLGKKLDEKQESRFNFDPLKLALNTMMAEFLYTEKSFYTLSVFISENKFKELPNFEKDNFRFNEREIQDILNLVGIPKSEKTNQKILKKYLGSNEKESLIYVLLKQLISAQKPTILATAGTQIDEVPEAVENVDISKKNHRKKTRKNHSLGKVEFRKKNKPNEVNLIVENLVGMSSNISAISEKLDRFKKSSETDVQDEKVEILSLVANTCKNLNDCVTNFENLCENIKNTKELNQKPVKTFDDWMNELENSENGKKFLRKLRKSYKSIVKEEKTKIKREFRRKFSNEKQKLKKEKQKHDKSVDQIETKMKELDMKEKSLENKLNLLDQKLINEPNTINPKIISESENVVDELTDFLKNTCLALKTLEKENEMYEKSMEINIEKNNLDKRKLQTEKSEIYGNLNEGNQKIEEMKNRKYQQQRMGNNRRVRATKTVVISSTSSVTSTSEISSDPSRKNES